MGYVKNSGLSEVLDHLLHMVSTSIGIVLDVLTPFVENGWVLYHWSHQNSKTCIRFAHILLFSTYWSLQ